MVDEKIRCLKEALDFIPLVQFQTLAYLLLVG